MTTSPAEPQVPRSRGRRRGYALLATAAVALAASVVAILPSGATTGTITTVAGRDVFPPFKPGYDGEGPATAHQVKYPEDVAVDAAGTIYIADTFNFRVRKVVAGTISTIVGNGIKGTAVSGPALATSVQLIDARSVAVNPAGTLLFVGDAGVATIYLVNIGTTPFTGYGVTVAPGNLQSITPQSIGTQGLALLPSTGELFVAEGNPGTTIERIDPATGARSTVAGMKSTTGPNFFGGDGGPATAAIFNDPQDVAVDPAGNLAIADSANARIRFVNRTAAPITRYGVTVAPGAIQTIAGGPNPYFGLGCIRNSNSDFLGSQFSDGTSALTATLGDCLRSVLFTSSGDVLFSDSEVGFERIRRITTLGGISTVAGTGICGYRLDPFAGDNITATASNLCHPMGLALDAQNNLYVADANNRRVRKIEGPQ